MRKNLDRQRRTQQLVDRFRINVAMSPLDMPGWRSFLALPEIADLEVCAACVATLFWNRSTSGTGG
jgi:hypothetical protein